MGGKTYLIVALFAVSMLLSSCAPVDGSGFSSSSASKEDRSTWAASQRSTDPAPCAKIVNNNFHDECYENVAVNTKDVSLCENIRGDVDFCKSDYASQTQDHSICGTLSTENHRSSCYARLAKDTLNSDLCAKVERTTTRDDCYWELSYGSDDPSICEAIEEDSKARDQCFSSVAQQTLDVTYCNKMEGDDFFKDGCVQMVAVASADFDLCEKLKGDNRNRCVDGVYTTCRSLYDQNPTTLPYYCQEGVMSPAGVPMTYD